MSKIDGKTLYELDIEATHETTSEGLNVAPFPPWSNLVINRDRLGSLSGEQVQHRYNQFAKKVNDYFVYGRKSSEG